MIRRLARAIRRRGAVAARREGRRTRPILPTTRAAVGLSLLATGVFFAAARGAPMQDAAGGVAPSVPVSFSEALRYARAHYPAVAAALAQKAAADRDVDVAKASYLPQVNLLYQINRATVNNVAGVLLPQSTVPAISGPVLPKSGEAAWNSAAGLLVSWRPVDFGFRAAKVEAARQADIAAERSAALTVLEVLTATSDAFMNLAAAQSLLQVARANADRQAHFARAVHALVDNKLRPGVEAAEADAAEANAQTALIAAMTNVKNQTAALAALIDRKASDLVIDARPFLTAPEAGTEAGTEAGPDAGGALEDSAARHPAAQVAAAKVRGQAEELRALSRQFAPQIDIVGSAFARGGGKTAAGVYTGGDNGLGPDVGNWAVGVQVTLPLGGFIALRAQSAAQRARLEAEEARYRQTLTELNERLAEARNALASARAVATLTPRARDAARQAEAQQRARFRSGLATALEVNAAEAALAQAESQDAIATLNIWRAEAALAAARGDVARLSAPTGSP